MLKNNLLSRPYFRHLTKNPFEKKSLTSRPVKRHVKGVPEVELKNFLLFFVLGANSKNVKPYK